MKYLIVGLGNIGPEYVGTRHNTGFMVADCLAGDAAWEDRRYGFVTHVRVKNQELVLLKPSTFVNLSGYAVRYWMQKEKIELPQLLVVVDDLSLPFGSIRIKPKGNAAGHNGLRHIETTLGTEEYARLRFGIGHDFPQGSQVDYVLGTFSEEEKALLPERLNQAAEAVKAFCLSGIDFAMNHYNKK